MKRLELVSNLILVRDKVDLETNKVSIKEPLIEVSAILTDIITQIAIYPVEE